MSASRLPPRPYPGIRPFNKDEWRIFYGRNAIINSVIDRLSDRQIIFVHGRSGCGKSSLIKAGVLPRLEREHSRYGMHWQTAQMRPGGSPLWNMAVAFAQLLPGHNADEAPELEAIESVLKRLYRGREALTYLAEELKIGQEASACILVDQFEELFRYSDNVNLDEATLFADVLSGFAHNPPEGIHAIATMRSDFLGDCANFEGLAELINESQFLLPKLTGNQLRDAITTPARLFGGEVSDDLATLLIQESRKHADALPLVEHCLMYLWQAAQREAPPEGHEGPWPVLTTDQFPGLRAALSDRADEVLRTLKGEVIGAGKATEFLFRAIIEVDAEGRATRRPLRRSEILNITGRDEETIDKIVEAFADRETNFLLLSNEAEDDPVIDMTHEALIRCWGQLTDETMEAGQAKGWIMREAADSQLWRDLIARSSDEKDVIPSRLLPERQEAYDRIAGPAWAERYGGQWKQVEALFSRSQDEARKERRRTILTNVGIGAAGIMIALSLYFNSQSTQATNRLLKYELSGKLANDVEAWRAASSRLRTEVTSDPLPRLYSDRANTVMHHRDKELALALEFLPNPSEAADFKRTLRKLNLEFEIETELRRVLSSADASLAASYPYSGADGGIQHSAYSSASGRLAIGGWTAQLRLFDSVLQTTAPQTVNLDHAEVRRLYWAPNGERLLISAGLGEMSILNIADEQRIELAAHQEMTSGGAWSADGDFVYTGSYDDTVRKYDAATGTLLNSWDPLSGQRDVNAIALSPDGTRLVAGVDSDIDKSLVFIELGDASELFHGFGENFDTLGYTYAVDWSSDGKWIAAGYSDGGFSVFNAETGEPLFHSPDYSVNGVWSIKFDPTSQRLVVVAFGDRASVYDLESMMQVAELLPGESESFVQGVDWSEDGKTVFVALANAVARYDLTDILRAGDGQTLDDLSYWIRDARLQVSRCFTPEERDKLGLTSEAPDWCQAKPPYLSEGLFISALAQLKNGNSTAALGSWQRARNLMFASLITQNAGNGAFDSAISELSEAAWEAIGARLNAERASSSQNDSTKLGRESYEVFLGNVAQMASPRERDVFQDIAQRFINAVGTRGPGIKQQDALELVRGLNRRSAGAISSRQIATMMAQLKLYDDKLSDAVWLAAEAIDPSAGRIPAAEQVYSLLPDSSWAQRELGQLPDDQSYFGVVANPVADSILVTAEYGSSSTGLAEGVFWDLARNTAVASIASEAFKYAFAPNGAAIVVAQSQDDLTVPAIWSADGATEIKRLQHDPGQPNFDTSWTVDWSDDGRWIASSNYSQITIWDATSGLPKQTINHHFEPVVDVQFSPDSAYLASTAYDSTAYNSTVYVTDVGTGELVGMTFLDSSAVRLSWAPDGNTLAIGGTGQFGTWDWRRQVEPEMITTDAGGDASHFAFDYSPDGTMIALTVSNRLQVWDLATRERVFVSNDQGRSLVGLAWLPGSKQIVTVSRDGRLIQFEPVDLANEIPQILADDPKCFSREERARMQLAEEPPAWCVPVP